MGVDAIAFLAVAWALIAFLPCIAIYIGGIKRLPTDQVYALNDRGATLDALAARRLAEGKGLNFGEGWAESAAQRPLLHSVELVPPLWLAGKFKLSPDIAVAGASIAGYVLTAWAVFWVVKHYDGFGAGLLAMIMFCSGPGIAEDAVDGLGTPMAGLWAILFTGCFWELIRRSSLPVDASARATTFAVGILAGVCASFAFLSDYAMVWFILPVLVAILAMKVPAIAKWGILSGLLVAPLALVAWQGGASSEPFRDFAIAFSGGRHLPASPQGEVGVGWILWRRISACSSEFPENLHPMLMEIALGVGPVCALMSVAIFFMGKLKGRELFRRGIPACGVILVAVWTASGGMDTGALIALSPIISVLGAEGVASLMRRARAIQIPRMSGSMRIWYERGKLALEWGIVCLIVALAWIFLSVASDDPLSPRGVPSALKAVEGLGSECAVATDAPEWVSWFTRCAAYPLPVFMGELVSLQDNLELKGVNIKGIFLSGAVPTGLSGEFQARLAELASTKTVAGRRTSDNVFIPVSEIRELNRSGLPHLTFVMESAKEDLIYRAKEFVFCHAAIVDGIKGGRAHVLFYPLAWWSGFGEQYAWFLYRFGSLLEARGRYADAMSLAGEAARALPRSSAARARLVELYLAFDKVKLAEQSVDILEALPGSQAFAEARLKAHALSDNFEKAAAAITDVVRIRLAQGTDFPMAYIKVLDCCIDAGAIEFAGRLAARLENLFPDDDEFKRQFSIRHAELLAMKGDGEGAITLLERLVATCPEWIPARLRLAGALSAAGRHSEAARTLQSMPAELMDQPDFYAFLADVRARSGDFKGAEALCVKALEKTPDNPSVLNVMAYWLSFNERNLETAENAAWKAHIADPSNIHYADTLAWIIFKRGRMKEADALFAPMRPVMWRQPLILYHYGCVLENNNNGPAAIRLLEDAVKRANGEEYWVPQANQTLNKLRKGIRK